MTDLPNLNTDTALLMVSLTAIISLALYLWEVRKSQKLLEEVEASSLEKIKERSFALLRKAYLKAQDILGRAELESVKVVATSRLTTKTLEEKYQTEISSVVTEMETSFRAEVGKAQKTFASYLEELKQKSDKAQMDTESLMQQRINQLFDKFEANLAEFLTQTESKATSSIELELKAARNLVDTYKQQQLKLIDENIIAMLEKTLSLVLTKKLTLRDQVDLVYEALEKAKVEKFIV